MTTSTPSGRLPRAKGSRAMWAFTTSLGLMWALACAAAVLLAVR
jgi:hypothetical protein